MGGIKLSTVVPRITTESSFGVDALMRPLHSPQNPKVNTALDRCSETAPRINTQPLFRWLVKNWHIHTHRHRHL